MAFSPSFRLNALFLGFALSLFVSFGHAQEEHTAPTMQDVLNGLEEKSAGSAADQQPTAVEQVNTETPVNEAPPLDAMNPDLVPKTAPDAPEAPTAERAETAPTPPKPPQYVAGKFAELGTLDKVTARTGTITVPVGETVAIGPLFLQVKTCQRSAPLEQPDSAAFLQVWEAVPKDEQKAEKSKGPSQWVFSGWMFASSPALSAMDHPIYDIWVLNCRNEAKASGEKSAAKKEDTSKDGPAKESDAKSDADKPKASPKKD